MSKLENILTTLYTSGALSNEEKMKKLLHPPRSLMSALYQNVLLPKNVKSNMQRSSSCSCSENHINLSGNVCFNKVADWDLQLYYERKSSTCVFLWFSFDNFLIKAFLDIALRNRAK